MWSVRRKELDVVVLQQIFTYLIGLVLFGVVHHIHVMLATRTIQIKFCSNIPHFINILFLLLFLVYTSLYSFPSSSSSQGLSEIWHESQEICAFDPFVEYLVAHVSFVRDSGDKSSVLDLDGNLFDCLLSLLSPSIAHPLFIEVKSGFIDEYDFDFSLGLCIMIW